jgi:hypothetical protein
LSRFTTTFISLCASLTAACASDTPNTPLAPSQPSFSIGNPINPDSRKPVTIAVIGDMPYGQTKLDSFPLLISLINADPQVEYVLHAGDIKAGKASPCDDSYFATIRSLFDTFTDPLIYTPGDNEWTDCHVATKNNGLFTPTERLQAVRKLFFPVAGQSLGVTKKSVLTQASGDAAYAAYVENTMWMESKVVFAALNITGSNNDLVSWGTPLPANASSYPSQAQESAERAKANSAWLNKAFTLATTKGAAGVVLLFQADMWDPAEPSLSGFDALVRQIGTLSARFGKPVLLLEGDSHVFAVQHPYSASSPVMRAQHPETPIAENVTRIVVEGSTNRTEYLRLTVDPTSSALFSWVRVPLQ